MEITGKTREIIEMSIAAREARKGPRVGDFVRFPTGELSRICLYRDKLMQTTTTPHGSFFMYGCGGVEFSGLSNLKISPESLIETDEVMIGEFWTFCDGLPGAGRRVDFKAPCRVFITTAPYDPFINIDAVGLAPAAPA
jgi:hypothetical protein